MVCKCVNDEGAPALGCDGTCSSARMINPDKQERAMEDSFTDRQLQQLSSLISNALRNITTPENIWIDGFIKGFQHGQENQ